MQSPFKLKYKMKFQELTQEKTPAQSEFKFRRFLPQFQEVQISSKAGNVKRVEVISKDDSGSVRVKSPVISPSSKHLQSRKSIQQGRQSHSYRT